MPRENKAAIGNTVKIGFGPIPGCMRANGQPETSAAPQQQRKDQPGHAGVQGSYPGFTLVEDVTESEQGRKTEGGWPKPDAGTKGELDISAVSEFFLQPNDYKRNPVKPGPFPGFRGVQGNALDVKPAGRVHQSKEQGQAGKAK